MEQEVAKSKPALVRQAPPAAWALALALAFALGAAADDAPLRAVAPLDDAGPAGVEAAIENALARLLVRVSGRRGAADLLDRFPPASSVVRQYRVMGGNRLEAEFDQALVRRILEEADEGVWDAERPPLALWLVVNDGEKWLFRPSQPDEDTPMIPNVRTIFSGATSRALSEVSALRGIELRYSPPPDPAAAAQCAEELWTGRFSCLPKISGAPLMLGRIAIPGAPEDIEWMLRENGQWGRVWEADAVEAVHFVTDMLSARFMATQGPVRTYRLVASPVPDFETYARLKAGLEALASVREWRVDGARQDGLVLRIASRTSEAALREALGSLGIPFELSRLDS